MKTVKMRHQLPSRPPGKPKTCSHKHGAACTGGAVNWFSVSDCLRKTAKNIFEI